MQEETGALEPLGSLRNRNVGIGTPSKGKSAPAASPPAKKELDPHHHTSIVVHSEATADLLRAEKPEERVVSEIVGCLKVGGLDPERAQVRAQGATLALPPLDGCGTVYRMHGTSQNLYACRSVTTSAVITYGFDRVRHSPVNTRKSVTSDHTTIAAQPLTSPINP
jgi:hypothetical protein